MVKLVLKHPCSRSSSSPANCGYSCYIGTFELSTRGFGSAAIFPRARDRLQIWSSGYRVT